MVIGTGREAGARRWRVGALEGRHRRRPGVWTQNLGGRGVGEREGGPLIGGPGGVARENYGGGAAAARGAAVRGELGAWASAAAGG